MQGRLRGKKSNSFLRVGVEMKFGQVMDVMCTEKPLAALRHMWYDPIPAQLVGDMNYHILTVRFEYNMPTQMHAHRKLHEEKAGGVERNGTESVSCRAEPMAHSFNNPVHELLRQCEEKTYVDMLQSNRKRKCSNVPVRGTPPMRPPPITQAVWNLKAVAPIIQWLHKRKRRYIHSDWVNEFRNGERVTVINQHGVVVSNRQTTHTKQYRCSAFHGVQMQCAKTLVNAGNHHVDWWKEDLSGVPSQGLQHGIMHSVYQKRIYAWDPYTHIHLTTTDGQQYNILVECHLAADYDRGTLQELLTVIAYHLSKHTKQQKRY